MCISKIKFLIFLFKPVLLIVFLISFEGKPILLSAQAKSLRVISTSFLFLISHNQLYIQSIYRSRPLFTSPLVLYCLSHHHYDSSLLIRFQVPSPQPILNSAAWVITLLLKTCIDFPVNLKVKQVLTISSKVLDDLFPCLTFLASTPHLVLSSSFTPLAVLASMQISDLIGRCLSESLCTGLKCFFFLSNICMADSLVSLSFRSAVSFSVRPNQTTLYKSALFPTIPSYLIFVFS